MEHDISMNIVSIFDSSNNIVDSDITDLSRIIRMLNNSIHIENDEEPRPHDNEEETMESNLYDIGNYRRHRSGLMNTMFNNIFTLLNNDNRNRIIDTNVSSNDDTAILNASFQQDTSVYKNVISEQGNEELKTVIFSKENIKTDTCPILHTPFEEGEEITQLPCNHVFDTTAINMWLQTEKAECPICRYKMSSKEIKIEQEHGAAAQGVTVAEGFTGAQGVTVAEAQIITGTQGHFTGYYSNRGVNRQIENENNSEDLELQQAILNSIQRTRDE